MNDGNDDDDDVFFTRACVYPTCSDIRINALYYKDNVMSYSSAPWCIVSAAAAMLHP
jgi:hypothetical protein